MPLLILALLEVRQVLAPLMLEIALPIVKLAMFLSTCGMNYKETDLLVLPVPCNDGCSADYIVIANLQLLQIVPFINAGNTQDLSSIELELLIPRVILSIKHTHSTIG